MEVLAPPMPSQARPIKTSYRFESIDLLRGLVMIIMALDHTRDFFHETAFTADPLDMQTTTPILFFTRWITHFCAPVFVFLAGASIYFQSLRKSKKDLSLFLIKRGIWLIFIELFIMSFGITFDMEFKFVYLQTIWAIGVSMLILGLVIWLPFKAILVAGLLIVLGHNSLDFYEKNQADGFSFFYNLLHRQAFYPFGNNQVLGILYPLLPWTGLMMVGYAFGKVFSSIQDPDQRRKTLAWMGAGVIVLFVILRWIDVYGNPTKWAVQKNGLYSFFSFLNNTKYPPSLLYMCMTIGPALLFLAWSGKARSRLSRIITVYGRVPFFYYILHFYLLHVITAVFFLARGHSLKEGINGIPGFPFNFVVPGEGYSLAVVYLVWLLAVASLYPVCKWFSDYKLKHKSWWLGYL
jgi:uncharacterized membrane protein